VAKGKRKRKPSKPVTIEEEVLLFENETMDEPKTCLWCESRKIRSGLVQVPGPFACIVQYLYCASCHLPVFKFDPVVLMELVDDRAAAPPLLGPTA
jgi:hypothetical protein